MMYMVGSSSALTAASRCVAMEENCFTSVDYIIIIMHARLFEKSFFKNRSEFISKNLTDSRV